MTRSHLGNPDAPLSQSDGSRHGQSASICVLIATYNGAAWLDTQLDSIEAQDGVDVSIVASDDASSDSTRDILVRRAAAGRLQLMPALPHRMGNANRNFLRLIGHADIGDSEFIALADQDDVWQPEKLRRAVDCLRSEGLDAVSSNVTAFWPDGRAKLLCKSQPMREFDYLFESAGPGCTFVFSRPAFNELRGWILQHWEEVNRAKVHDWLIYAYARRFSWRWRIDERALMMYRQHHHNEVGANDGWRAIMQRLTRAVSGTFRIDSLLIADMIEDRSWAAQSLRRFGLRDRLRLVVNARQLRRRRRDSLVLAFLLLMMRKRAANPS